MSFDPGSLKIQCIKPGGVTLTKYGQYEFEEDEEIDLVSESTPATLRAEYETAWIMCADIGFELAQRIAAGEFEITEAIEPSYEDLE